MDLIEAIRSRRAVRAYEDRPVAEAGVKGLIDAAVLAPSALNAQPWAFAVIQDPPLLRRLSDRAKAHWLEMAPGDPVTVHLREVLGSPDYDVFHHAGTLVVVCATSDRPGAAEDCFLAGENLMLAAVAMGLATCPIGLARPLLNQPDVKAQVGIPADLTAVLPIVVGHPRGETPHVPRNPPRIACWRRASAAAPSRSDGASPRKA